MAIEERVESMYTPCPRCVGYIDLTRPKNHDCPNKNKVFPATRTQYIPPWPDWFGLDEEYDEQYD